MVASTGDPVRQTPVVSADDDRSGVPRPDAPEVAAGALTLGYNAVLHKVLPEVTYIPTNLAAAGALTGLAVASGCDADDLGLARRHVARGVKLGLTTAVALSCAVALAVALPGTRRFFEEDRVGRTREGVYHAAVRIPIGTALAEELIFRGALFGILARRRSTLQAALVSSALFGVWHVLPAHESFERDRGTDEARPAARAAAVAGNVAFTTAAGLGFSWLRVRSRSLAAPVIVHAAVNAAAYVGSWWASGRAA